MGILVRVACAACFVASILLVPSRLIAAQPAGSEDTYYVHGHYYHWQQAAADFQAIAPTLKNQLQQAPFPQLYNSFTPFGQYLDRLSAYDAAYIALAEARDAQLATTDAALAGVARDLGVDVVTT